jgi:hypothetical protein
MGKSLESITGSAKATVSGVFWVNVGWRQGSANSRIGA